MSIVSSLDPQFQSWIRGLDVTVLQGTFGVQTANRGAAYAAQKRVVLTATAPNAQHLSGMVVGSMAYRVDVQAEFGPHGHDPSWYSTCSCPIGGDCKHTVALLLTAREQLGPEPAAGTGKPVGPAVWEQLLLPVAQAEKVPSAAPVGLEYSVHRIDSKWAPQRTVLRFRPMVPGARQNWIKTGISWDHLGIGSTKVPIIETHRRALRRIRLAADANSSHRYGALPFVDAAELGPELWDLIADAVRIGVTLLPAPGLRDLILLDAPAEAVVHVRATDDGVQLEPMVQFSDGPVSRDQIHLLGSPAFGCFAVQTTQAGVDVRVARFAAPLEAPLARLLQADPVAVPEADLARLTCDYLPALRQRISLTGDLDLLPEPDVSGPLLRVELQPKADHALVLQHSFRYLVNDTPLDVPTDSAEPVVPGLPHRDLDAEHNLLAAIDVLHDPVGLITKDSSGTWRVAARVRLTGANTARYVEHVLPDLEADELVVVARPAALTEYREATDAPTVTLSVTDSDSATNDWFDLGITVSVDGVEIEFAPLFRALAANEEFLVLDSGLWFSLDRPELHQLRSLIEEARALSDPTSSGLTLNRLHAGLWEELVALGVIGEQSERWQRSVGSLMALDELPDPEPPDRLKAELRPYQQRGYAWLSLLWDHGLGGLLADDMGLGKTVQTLALAQRALERGELEHPLLVVAPTSVIGTWAEQAARFCPDLRVATVTATARKRETALRDLARDHDIIVTSYTLLRLDAEEYHAVEWSGIVLDEAQSVKNFRGKTYQAVRRVRAPFRLAITGTPLENSLMDLWALLSIAAPGLYPDPDAFTEQYRKPIEQDGDSERLDRLRRRIKPLMLRRRKQDVAPELPPKIEQVLSVELSPAHRKVYTRQLQRERQRVLGLLDDVQRNRIAILSSLTRLRQLALAPELVDTEYASAGSSKLDAMMDHLAEVISEGHRALVFSQFTGFLGLLRQRLDAAGIDYAYLDGRTRDRARRIADFREGDAPLFLISLKAGGFGITLTEADYVFVLDPWWNPAAEEQAIDRTHRIGQDRTVMVYRLVAADTIEEKVVALQERKRRLFGDVIEGDGGSSGPITAEDIRELLQG